MNRDIREFFMLTYSECNTHAREQPKKRDQVILFYMAICYFYVSQYLKLSSIMFWAMTAAMIALGTICSYIVFDLRSWTIQYSKAAEVIGRLLVKDENLNTKGELVAAIKAECKTVDKLRQISSFFKRSGNYVSLGFCFITLAPAAAIIDRYISYTWIVAVTVAISLFYYIFAICWLMKIVKEADARNENAWIIRFSDPVEVCR